MHQTGHGMSGTRWGRPLSFVLCPLSFVLCPLSFVLCPLPFVRVLGVFTFRNIVMFISTGLLSSVSRSLSRVIDPQLLYEFGDVNTRDSSKLM